MPSRRAPAVCTAALARQRSGTAAFAAPSRSAATLSPLFETGEDDGSGEGGEARSTVVNERDLHFWLEECFGSTADLCREGTKGFAEADEETMSALVEASVNLATNVYAPANADTDRVAPVYHRDKDVVTHPESAIRAQEAYAVSAFLK